MPNELNTTARGRRNGANGGIGIDVVDVDRIRTALRRNPGITELAFTSAEVQAAGDGPGRAARLAGVFAAKEAFLKAVGLGLWQGVSMNEIEVTHSTGIRPELRLGPTAVDALERLGCHEAHVSLSVRGGTAMAFVMVQ